MLVDIKTHHINGEHVLCIVTEDTKSLLTVHQALHLSLLAVVGDEADQHRVPGEDLETGHAAGLSGEERVSLENPHSGPSEAAQQLHHVRQVVIPGDVLQVLPIAVHGVQGC